MEQPLRCGDLFQVGVGGGGAIGALQVCDRRCQPVAGLGWGDGGLVGAPCGERGDQPEVGFDITGRDGIEVAAFGVDELGDHRCVGELDGSALGFGYRAVDDGHDAGEQRGGGGAGGVHIWLIHMSPMSWIARQARRYPSSP